MSTYIFMQAYECLLDQKAHLNCIDYETNTYIPNVVDAVGQPIIPTTKAHFAAAIASPVAADEEYQPVDPSSILQLTPPQSPPQSPPQFDGYKQQPELSPAPVLVKVEQKPYYATDAIPAVAPATPFSFNAGHWVAGSEIARENQLIDDIVNMRAQELELPPNWQQLNDDCESQASSSMGCSSSSSSSSSRVSGSIADVDDDWLPEQTSSSSSSPAYTSMENTSMAAPKKRTRTYGRGVEDRKIRKKEQNKNAATRYRQKKKIEMESVLGEEHELTQENEGLRRTLRERRSEMRYLRQLIREFYQERKR
ncbi:GL26659 [Drosophila persimilis]|uniref:Activating transcription factor of chaperone isoform X2 n=2 Tax=pseudoobscura subgroup TaxID=32358 RepID=B5DJQ9_DROPS|nr:activating transcription factor of chaperone isoform X2 [Drosophila persimilis]XP_002133130.1 activating transcription factor of chaperone isoform X2 [Drosophila pseudoobscura]EDW25558.1 GL26659 [Drosophila persimilis]